MLVVLIGATLCLAALPVAGASASVRGDCNEATATALGDEYDLNPFAPIYTGMSPLCGEFLGPGIEAMVDRALPATCGGYAGWAVFRHEADGSWQLVFKERDGQWELNAVGNDLEEVDKILGPREPRCLDARTTKTRIWHWNGQQFVAGPWTVHLSGPSGAFDARWGRSGVLCFVADNPKLEPPPPGSVYHNGATCVTGNSRHSQQADLYPSGRVKTCRVHRPTKSCAGSYCGCDENIPQIHANEEVVVGRYTCQVRKHSVKCFNEAGQGFVINQKRIKRLA
jgi:hypothetical protein